jgi:hypothetical protein
VTGPLPAGARLGEVLVSVDGRRVARVPLLASEPVPGASFWRKTAIDVAGTDPTVALGIIGVVLVAVLQLRGPLLRRMQGGIGRA